MAWIRAEPLDPVDRRGGDRVFLVRRRSKPVIAADRPLPTPLVCRPIGRLRFRGERAERGGLIFSQNRPIPLLRHPAPALEGVGLDFVLAATSGFSAVPFLALVIDPVTYVYLIISVFIGHYPFGALPGLTATLGRLTILTGFGSGNKIPLD